jgi:hypothetical protein
MEDEIVGRIKEEVLKSVMGSIDALREELAQVRLYFHTLWLACEEWEDHRLCSTE